MTTIAFEAEKMGHHPDWCNSYNTVKINLSSHSVNGITQNDLDLAGKMDNFYKIYAV